MRLVCDHPRTSRECTTLMPPTRRIAFHHRQSLRGALHRVRLDMAPARSWNVCNHCPVSAVPTRSLPHHARVSPRLRSVAYLDATIRCGPSFEEAQPNESQELAVLPRVAGITLPPGRPGGGWRFRRCRQPRAELVGKPKLLASPARALLCTDDWTTAPGEDEQKTEQSLLLLIRCIC